jgi:hypothetical protein
MAIALDAKGDRQNWYTYTYILTDLDHYGVLRYDTVVLFTQYCVGDKIKKNEMGEACSAYE